LDVFMERFVQECIDECEEILEFFYAIPEEESILERV